MTELRQIAPIEEPRLEVGVYRTPDQHWEEVVGALYGDARVPVNVVYVHQPGWDREFLSIQNVADQVALFGDGRKRFRVGFWTVIGGLMIIADLVWYFHRSF